MTRLPGIAAALAGASFCAASLAASTAPGKSDDSLFRKKLSKDDQIIHAVANARMPELAEVRQVFANLCIGEI